MLYHSPRAFIIGLSKFRTHPVVLSYIDLFSQFLPGYCHLRMQGGASHWFPTLNWRQFRAHVDSLQSDHETRGSDCWNYVIRGRIINLSEKQGATAVDLEKVADLIPATWIYIGLYYFFFLRGYKKKDNNIWKFVRGICSISDRWVI